MLGLLGVRFCSLCGGMIGILMSRFSWLRRGLLSWFW